MLFIDENTRRAGRSSDTSPCWWTTPYGQWRRAAEIEAMRRFPQFELQLCQGALVWEGSLVSALGAGNRYRIRLTYTDSFPDEPPQVVIVEPDIDPCAPHILSRRRPCLFRWYGPGRGYEPARTTAATLIAWTALWIHAYETWQQTGEWPGEGD
jgi:hypothetical protein